METHLRIPQLASDRSRNLLLAILFGVIAAILVVAYVHSYKHHVNAGSALVNVLVASGDLTPGMKGTDVASHVRVEAVPRSQLVSQPVLTAASISKLYVSQPIYSGDQLTLQRFASIAEPGPRGQISGKLRLIQVPGDNNQLLAGLIQAGDYVDVVASVKIQGASGQAALARTILTDLRVVQTPQKATNSGSNSGQTSVMLAVPDAAVPKLFYVLKNADWSLVLRPRFAASSPSVTASAPQVLGAGASK